MSEFMRHLREHLATLEASSITPIDQVLVDRCSHILPLELSPAETAALVQELSSLVPTLPQDPSALNGLLLALLAPFSFSDILGLAKDINFVSGLAVAAVPYHRLLLSILDKATHQAADAATIAARPEIIPALILLWLSTTDPGVGQLAGSVFSGLLSIDYGNGIGNGQGLVWRRVFKDRDVYRLLFSLTTHDKSTSDHDLSRSQRTLAQSRLLEVLPKLCKLDWETMCRSHDQSIESIFGGAQGTGLLNYACLHMVDTTDDVLMHKCLIDFYADLVAQVTQRNLAGRSQSSIALDHLDECGIHDKILEMYIDPSEEKHGVLEVQFLYASAAAYVATYATVYPELFQVDTVVPAILKRLEKVLTLSPSQWSQLESPKHDLRVLTSLPRVLLLPSQLSLSAGLTSSIIALLPTSDKANADALYALATIFRGPTKVESITFPEESPMMSSIDERGLAEAQYARVLYYIYVNNYNPRMFADLVRHADSVALTDVALAAISLITAIIKANWAPLPLQSPTGLSEGFFVNMLPQPTPPIPFTSVQALLSPPSLEYTLPYLMKPARSFTNLVGGRGDTESAAYKVASAKFGALQAMVDRIQGLVDAEPGQGYEEILDTLIRTVARGPWSQGGGAGGQVATLEL